MRKPSLSAALLATGLIFVATAASALAAYAPTLTGSQNGAKTTISPGGTPSSFDSRTISSVTPSSICG